MKKICKIIACGLCVLMILGLQMSVHAHAVPDMNMTGTIQVTMSSGDVRLSEGTLNLYRVGKVVQTDGNYSFVPDGDFQDAKKVYEDVGSSLLAQELMVYAQEHHLTSLEVKDVSEDGEVIFENLQVGLYLIVQQKAATGYSAASPFLVSLPTYVNDEYQYMIDASPKVEVEWIGIEEEPDEHPSQPGQLPQTGQLKWPVLALTAAGVLSFAWGWYLRFGKRDEYEK